MPTKYPPMTATVAQPSPDVCDITIEHDIAQSYSRAVDPKAMSEARRRLRDGRTWRLTDADYGYDQRDRRTHSRFTFLAAPR